MHRKLYLFYVLILLLCLGIPSLPCCNIVDLHETTAIGLRTFAKIGEYTSSSSKEATSYLKNIDPAIASSAIDPSKDDPHPDFFLIDDKFPSCLLIENNDDQQVSRPFTSVLTGGICNKSKEPGSGFSASLGGSLPSSLVREGQSIQRQIPFRSDTYRDVATTWQSLEGGLRPFLCSVWRDKVIGVGGSFHAAEGLNMWDGISGKIMHITLDSHNYYRKYRFEHETDDPMLSNIYVQVHYLAAA